MQEVIDNITEKIRFQKKEAFSQFLNKCIHIYKPVKYDEREELRDYKSVVFKLNTFFKNFSPFQSEFGTDKKYEAGVEALYVISDELGIEIDKSECFILFHLRDQGKFKIKEEKLFKELKSLWPHYKEYELADQDFSRALRNLRDERMIDYRKRTLVPCPTVLIRYK
jgi:hypothetical protein